MCRAVTRVAIRASVSVSERSIKKECVDLKYLQQQIVDWESIEEVLRPNQQPPEACVCGISVNINDDDENICQIDSRRQ